jgi:hypothetical protein
MRRLTALLVLCLVAGCGGDDKKDTATGATAAAPAGTEVRAQDAEAKAAARTLTTYLEACYADTQDYSACDTDEALGATDLTLGSDGGQVEVLDATAASYRVVAHSASGNTYTIEKTDAGMQRSCEAAVETPSCPDATW